MHVTTELKQFKIDQQTYFFKYLEINNLIPKSSLFGKISVPSSDIHASTDTKSATKEGKLHFNVAALPRNTNSSMTRV